MTSERLALIVAVDEYDNDALGRLNAPAADADALATVLSAPELGAFDVDVVRNATSWAVSQRIEELLASCRPSDLVLLHFSCHGIKDDNGQLYLAATNTVPDRPASTAIEATWVRRLMHRSRAQRIILFLDCCYGGAFGRGVAARASERIDVADQFQPDLVGDGGGLAVIPASTATEYAFEGPQLTKNTATPSMFTAAIVAGIQTGEADRDEDGRVSLDELYDYVYDHVRQHAPQQTPSMWEFGTRGELYIAANPHRHITPGRLPQEVLDLVDHPTATGRAAAVDDLSRIAGGSNLQLAAAARLTLHRLVEDDSRRVSLSAEEALRRTEVHLTTPAADLPATPPGTEPLLTEIGVEGGPLALASSVSTSDNAVTATIESGALRVAWIPDKPGGVEATVTLAGPAGDTTLRIIGDTARSRSHTPASTQVPPTTPAVGPPTNPADAAEPAETEPPPAETTDPIAAPDSQGDPPRQNNLEPRFQAGCTAAERHDWSDAVDAFEDVPAIDAGYQDARTRLDHALTAQHRSAARLASRRWRWLHSIWTLGPLLSLGFLTWASFLYIAVRANHRPWLIAGALYAATTVFVFIAGATSKRGEFRAIDALGVTALLATWILGFVHAILINRKYLKMISSQNT